jgi:hypothetical protein
MKQDIESAFNFYNNIAKSPIKRMEKQITKVSVNKTRDTEMNFEYSLSQMVKDRCSDISGAGCDAWSRAF